MENPSTWTKAEWIVSRAMAQADSDREDMIVGLSTVRRITDALREAGLLPTDLPSLGTFRPPKDL